jgi:hypothetical protein
VSAIKINIGYPETGLGAVFYIIMRRVSDGKYVASLSGGLPVYQVPEPDPRPTLAEDAAMPKVYTFGPLTVADIHEYAVYKQIGGAQSPIDDDMIATGNIEAASFSSLQTDTSRILGLVLNNHVEDDIVRDNNGLKVSSIIYCYDTSVNAVIHDKATGIIGKYAVTVTYLAARMTKITSTRVI